MKKVLFTLLAFVGLLMSVQTQSCCTTQKENCKPKTCCPSTPKCCENDKSTSNIGETKKKKVSKTKTITNKTNAVKKEVAIVEPKKTNYEN